jgi:hypothetical protein
VSRLMNEGFEDHAGYKYALGRLEARV